MGNLQHITRFEVFVNQYGWMDGLTQHKRFSGGNRECVRRSLPETRQYCRLWKYCWWIRRKNPRLNRSTERSRRSPPYTFTVFMTLTYQLIPGFSIRLCSGLTFKSRYYPRSGLAKDVFSLLVSFFLFGNENPIF